MRLVVLNTIPNGGDKLNKMNYQIKRNKILLKEFRNEERFFCNPNSHIYDVNCCKIIWEHIENLEKKKKRLNFNKLLIKSEQHFKDE